MNSLIVIAAVAVTLSICSGQPVKREQRKFIYQDGYPSVRRYPVYPDRLSDLDNSIPSEVPVVKNDIEESPLSLMKNKPMMMTKEEEEKVEEAPSTDANLFMRSESTEAPEPMKPSPTPLVEETTPFEENFLAGFFTPKPATILEESLFPEEQPTNNETFDFFEGGRSQGSSVFPKTSSSPSLFAEAPEESTGFPLTTDLDTMMAEGEEEGEAMMSEFTTNSPEREMDELTEDNTEIAFLDRTATESDWNTVTEEYPTEQPGFF